MRMNFVFGNGKPEITASKIALAKSFWFGLWFFAAVIIVLIPTINDLPRFIMLLATAVVFCCSVRTADWRRIGLLSLVVAIIFILRLVLPIGQLAEQHQLFLIKDSFKPDASFTALPPEVLIDFTEKFEKTYPLEKRCDAKIYGCWRNFQLPVEPYAWSADNFWQRSPNVTRMVREIEVHDVPSARLGVLNDTRYNWYNVKEISDVQRDTAPFWASYVLPSEASGGQLCWQGVVWFRQNDQAQAHQEIHAAQECRVLTNADINAHIWIGFIDPAEQQTLKLLWPLPQQIWRGFDFAVTLFGLIVLIAGTLKPRLRMLVCGGLLTAAAFAVFTGYCDYMLSGVMPFAGGDDGLVHAGYGRLIGHALYNGDWGAALMGAEKSYYYMPGLRYLVAMQQLIFGEMHYGIALGIMLFPFLIWRVLFYLGLEKWTVPFLVLSFFTIKTSDIFGASYHFYVDQASKCISEPMGYSFFLLGLIVVVKQLRLGFSLPRAYWLGAGLLWGLAVFFRPNLLIACSLSILFCLYHLLRISKWREAFLLCLGMSFIFLCTVHNLYFDDKFFLLTSSVGISANQTAPPATYLTALHDIIAGNYGEPSVLAIQKQVTQWAKGYDGHALTWGKVNLTAPFRIIALLAIFCLFALRVYRQKIDRIICLLSIVVLGLQAPLFFYIPFSRYAQLAWLMTLILLLRLLPFGATNNREKTG